MQITRKKIYLSNNQLVGKFHHSSFLGGQPVAAAGEIEIQEGIIQLINRKSGHYRPTTEMLEQFLNELKRRGADLSKAVIGGI